MDPFKQFDVELGSCKKCASILSKFHVDPCESDEIIIPKPIVSGISKKPLMVIGQTPGLTEYRTGRPFQGQAGKGIRGELSKLGVHEFDRYVFSSAVAKCFPGRKHRKANDPSSKCEDRQPPATMVNNCRLFLKRQVDLADPSIIITLGSTALKAYLEMSGQHVPAPRLENYVGKTEGWGKRIVVFFPHTSGSARWLNAHSNKLLFDKAKNLLRIALLERGVLNA